MPGIDGNFVQFRDDPVDPERLIPELAFLHNGRNSLGSGTFCVVIHQVGGIHVSVLPVRGGHFIPGGAGLRDHLHGQGVLIGREDLIISARAVAEV